jgi:SAM-dependent methyltransferase
MEASVDTQELETKVKDMYRHVAEQPEGQYHFELGRPLAEHLGYPPDILDHVPDGACESFAGVGYFFDLAEQVGLSGAVTGIDFTAEQLAKARRIANESGYSQVDLREGRIEDLPAEAESFDCVISNGVINLAPDKGAVFAEAARVLRPGGRLAIADIVSEQQMKESIVCDADLWASCIGGAAQVDAYREAIEGSGLWIEQIRDNPYEFISDRARDAGAKYGVKSVSLLAVKPSR